MKKFTECVDIVGSTCIKFDGQKEYISTGALEGNNINHKKTELITYEDKPSRANLIVHKGDIIFAKMQFTNKTLMIDSENERNVYSTGFFAVSPKEKVIESKCLFHILNSPLFLKEKDKNCSGATQKAITNQGLSKIVLNIPKYSEQEMISKKLDKVIEVIDSKKKQIKRLDNLIKSRFVEMFGDPVNNSMKWKVLSLGNLCSKISSGNTPKGGSKVYVNEGVMFFRSQNVWKNHLILDDIAYIDKKTHESMKDTSLKHEDILITKTGRINTENSSLGRSALYLGEDDIANINGHVYLVRINSKNVNRRFVLQILISSEFRDLIRRVCVGGIDKRQLNRNHIENFPIILPPINLQNQFASFVQQVDKSKFELEEIYKNYNYIKILLYNIRINFKKERRINL